MLWIPCVAGVLIGYAVTGLTIKLSLRRGVLDFPTTRSLHFRPIPRLGGLGIVLGTCLPVVALWILGLGGMIRSNLETRDVAIVLLGGSAMAAAGLYDDLHRATPGKKFLLQLGVAGLVIALGARVENVAIPFFKTLQVGVLSIPLTILWITGFANVYNFMDGINGLSAVTGAAYGIFFFLFAIRQGAPQLATLALLLAGSCLGFLFHNFPEARTFMGDNGSLFLGGAFAVLALRLAQSSTKPESQTALLLTCSVYIYDCGFTLLRRLKHRENIFEAHRSHLYQRLVAAGLPHTKITFLYLILHLLMGTLALFYLDATSIARLLILGVASMVLFGFTMAVYWFENRVAKANSQVCAAPHA